MTRTRASLTQAEGPGALERRYPCYADLRARARRRLPAFCFDYVDTGAGDETGLARNRAALEALDMVPRFGATPPSPSLSVSLFGRRYALPAGIAPMGLTGLAWPGADVLLARAAQKANIPFVLATGASLSIERAAELAGDVLWFQLYHIPRADGSVALDLVRRAEQAGAQVLVLTVDSAARAKRPRDLRNGLVPPFRITPPMVLQALGAPAWTLALLRHGLPRFENLVAYVDQPARPAATAAFAVREVTGSFGWDDIARIREVWPRALVVKGILHPADGDKAVAAGADGVWVSNHGGRLFDAAPASLTMLPAMAEAVDGRASVLVDSGVQGGADVVRARALGAEAAFAGRAFLFAVAALGRRGGDHMAALLAHEISDTLKFLGLDDINAVTAAILRR